MPYRAPLPYAPDAMIFAARGADDAASGAKLAAAYAAARNLQPGGQALSATNRACVVIPPGRYKLASTLVLDAQYVDLVALVPQMGLPLAAGEADDVGFKGHGTEIYNADGDHINTIEQAVTDVRLVGFAVVNYDLSKSAFLVTAAHNAPSLYDRMTFWRDRGGGSEKFPVGAENHFSGTWFSCVANGWAYRQSFGSTGDFRPVMYDCHGGKNAFIGDQGNGAVGARLERCRAGIQSFGGCASYGVPIDADSVLIDCTAGERSFALGKACAGTFIRCRGGDTSFGATVSQYYVGEFSGHAEDCYAGKNSFGGRKAGVGANGKCTGELLRCRSVGSDLALRLEGAKIRECLLTTTAQDEDGVVLVGGLSKILDTTILVFLGGTGVPINDDGSARSVVCAHCRLNNATSDADGVGPNVTNLIASPANVVDDDMDW